MFANDRPNALNNYFLIGVFLSLSFAMLLQSYRPMFPPTIYYLLVIIFVAAIGFSILLNKELTAVVGIFTFSIVIRLMYYVSTRFSVFPEGDPYSQYSVLLYFSQTSHVTIFHGASFLNFLTRIPHQYSEWPGFQAFSLSLSRITNLPLFWTALTVPFILYAVWFVLSYAIVRKVFANFGGSVSTLSLLSIAVATSLPTFELPIVFKYDFIAAIFFLTIILLLAHNLNIQTFEKSLLLLVLIVAIVVTHSLTALFLVIFMTLLGVAFVIRALIPILVPRFKQSGLLERSSRARPRFSKLFLFVLASIAGWWTYYATFVVARGIKSSSYLFRSFSLSFLSLSRVGSKRASVLGSLAPTWLIHLLHYRDELLLGLVALGALILVVRPKILGKRPLIAAILLSIGVVTLVTEALQTLNFGDRAFLTFAPILACFVVLPVAAIATWKPNLAKMGGILIVFLFLFTVAVGFWGSAYAPVYLYSKYPTAYSFGEHPANWQEITNYVNYATSSANSSSPTCILTNEIYVTSLAVSLQDLALTYPFTDIRTRPGCIAVIYDSLLHFNSSVIGEQYAPYTNTSSLPAFSDATFSNILYNQSDLVFDGGNATIYYKP